MKDIRWNISKMLTGLENKRSSTVKEPVILKPHFGGSAVGGPLRFLQYVEFALNTTESSLEVINLFPKGTELIITQPLRGQVVLRE